MIRSCDCGSLNPLVTVAWKSAFANQASSAQMIGSMISVSLTVGRTRRKTLRGALNCGLSSGLLMRLLFWFLFVAGRIPELLLQLLQMRMLQFFRPLLEPLGEAVRFVIELLGLPDDLAAGIEKRITEDAVGREEHQDGDDGADAGMIGHPFHPAFAAISASRSFFSRSI